MVSRADECGGLLFEDAVGKIFGENLFCEAEDDGVLDGVFQFADVARPTVFHEQGSRAVRDAFEDALALLGIFFCEVKG